MSNRRTTDLATNRRSALKTGFGSLAFGGMLSEQAAAAHLDSDDPGITELAEQLMETEPEAVIEFAFSQLDKGRSANEMLAACCNAGQRFHGHHSSYVAHPVGVVAQTMAGSQSLLPLAYYLSVLRFRARKNALRWLDKTQLPKPDGALDRFHRAMELGERDDAGLALVSLGRSEGFNVAYQHLWKWAAERNHNSGGHTAVSVVNTFRTLQSTNWRCAESGLQFAVTDEVWRPPGGSEVWRVNRERTQRVKELPTDWKTSPSRNDQVEEMLAALRTGYDARACTELFERLINGELCANSAWDAIFLATTELMVRYQWVGSKRLAGHSMTCVNALHYVFRTVVDEATQLLQLLEAAEWAASFLARERSRPALREFDLLSLEPAALSDAGVDQIFDLLPPRRFAAMHRPGFEDVDHAMRLAYSWLREHGNADFERRAMELMCHKSTPEVHDFKYPIALFENARFCSPRYRTLMLAASVHVLHGTDMETSPTVMAACERLGIEPS